MERMDINLISLVQRNGIVAARARANALPVGVRMMMEIRFKPEPSATRADWWEEAYDWVLAVLDPA